MRNISNYAKLGLLAFLIACSSSVALAKSSRPAGLYLNPFLGPPGSKINHVTVALFPNRQYCMQREGESGKVRLSQNGKEIDMLGYADDQCFIKREGVSPKKFWRSLKIEVCNDYR